MSNFRKDHGWAWIIALSTSVSRVLQDGIVKAFGVMLPTLSFQFEQEVWVIGTTISLMTFVGGIVGILAGPMTKVVQPKWIIMLCGISTCLGFILCSLASDWTFFGICIVVIAGIPMRFSGVILLGSLGDHFEKYYAIANGLAFIGSSVGIMTFAPLTQLLLDSYGWKGTMIIIGGISSNIIVCGAVFNLRDKHANNDGYTELSATQYSTEHGNKRNFLRKTIISVFNRIGKVFNFDYFQEPLFMGIFVAEFAYSYSWTGWVTYLVPYALFQGLAPYFATSLATAGGIGYLIGSILLPLILNRQFDPRYICVCGLIISGSALLLYPFFDTLPKLAIISFIYGLSTPSFLSIFSICKNLNNNLTQSIAWTVLSSCLGKIVAGFLTGWIYDVTKSYDISFLTLGGVQLAAAVIMGILSVLQQNKDKDNP